MSGSDSQDLSFSLEMDNSESCSSRTPPGRPTRTATQKQPVNLSTTLNTRTSKQTVPLARAVVDLDSSIETNQEQVTQRPHMLFPPLGQPGHKNTHQPLFSWSDTHRRLTGSCHRSCCIKSRSRGGHFPWYDH